MSSLARSAGEVSRSDGGGCCSEESPRVGRAPSVSPLRGDPPPPRGARWRTGVPLLRQPPPALRATSPGCAGGGQIARKSTLKKIIPHP